MSSVPNTVATISDPYKAKLFSMIEKLKTQGPKSFIPLWQEDNEISKYGLTPGLKKSAVAAGKLARIAGVGAGVVGLSGLGQVLGYPFGYLAGDSPLGSPGNMEQAVRTRRGEDVGPIGWALKSLVPGYWGFRQGRKERAKLWMNRHSASLTNSPYDPLYYQQRQEPEVPLYETPGYQLRFPLGISQTWPK
jgi:hypothetical protein